MKTLSKILSLFCLLAVAFQTFDLNASSPKRVLLEAFTNSGCGPCAESYPTWDASVKSHPDLYIPLKYHVQFPDATDVMYLAAPAPISARQNYYAINAVPGYCKQGKFVDYTDENIENWIAPTNDYETVKTQTSPVTLNITQTNQGQNISVSVQIQSDESLAGKTLRVVLVEPYFYYAGNNGSSDHEWVVRGMLPNANGTPLTLEAGASTTIELTGAMAAAIPAKNIYVVAFVQDDATKEVLQANSNLDDRQAVAQVTTIQSQSDKIGRSDSKSKTFTVKNIGKYAETFDLTTGDYVNSIVGADLGLDYKVQLSKTSVTLEPGASEDVELTVNSGTKAFYTRLAVIATPNSSARFAVSDQIAFDFLTSDAKYAAYIGYGNSSLYSYLKLIADPKYSNELVLLPMFDNIYENFSPTQFDLGMFAFSANNYSTFIQSYGSKTINAITSMLNAGKRVCLNGEFGASLMSNPEIGMSSTVRTFFSDRLNVSGAVALARYTQSGNSATINPFTVKGISSDIIGSTINSITCNQNTQNYNLVTDALTMGEDGPANIVPFAYYDNNQAQIAGIRAEYASGRLVFTSFGFDAIATESVRNDLIGNIVTWLLNDVSDVPTIQVTEDFVDFGNVMIGETATHDVTISNSGMQPLEISSIVLEGSKEFQILNNPGDNYTLNFGDSYVLTLAYTPTDKDENNADVLITSNAVLAPEVYISLLGVGISETEIPTATISASELSFGEVELLESKELSFQLKNTGNAPLTVKSVSFSANNPAVFEVTQGYDTPYYLEPNDSEEIIVNFTPFAAVEFTGVLDVQTDDPKNPILQISLSGIGKDSEDDNSVKDKVSAQNGNFEMQVLPNPVVATGNIQFTALNNPMNIELSIIDAAGRTINTLYSQNNVLGTVSIPLNANNYANGYYTIIGTINGEQVGLPLVIQK